MVGSIIQLPLSMAGHLLQNGSLNLSGNTITVPTSQQNSASGMIMVIILVIMVILLMIMVIFLLIMVIFLMIVVIILMIVVIFLMVIVIIILVVMVIILVIMVIINGLPDHRNLTNA